MVVPVSQFVLPVGVTGLTVNGKTPTPEPGNIVGTAAVRFKERQENTRLCFVQKAQFNVTHKHTADGIIAACMHMDVASFLGHSRQPAKERSHLMYYKAQQGEC